jgi:Uma2 family endonuclease
MFSFGSATMKRKEPQKGTEPDACFSLQSALSIGPRIDPRRRKRPPPHFAAESGIQDDQIEKFPLYAGLGVLEVGR